jgi:hypothetical protein
MHDNMGFQSLSAALRAGYSLHGRTKNGYRVRVKTKKGWAIVRVVCNADCQSAGAR